DGAFPSSLTLRNHNRDLLQAIALGQEDRHNRRKSLIPFTRMDRPPATRRAIRALPEINTSAESAATTARSQEIDATTAKTPEIRHCLPVPGGGPGLAPGRGQRRSGMRGAACCAR